MKSTCHYLIAALVAVLAVSAVTAKTPRNSRNSRAAAAPAKKEPTAVDLGLSVKWADRNLGAYSPYEYGGYYAWGETAPKKEFYDSLCATWEKHFDYTEISGDTLYDAASLELRNAWRIPTSDEIKALVDSCKWTPTTLNKVKGYRVTGPSGESIFLPMAGLMIHNSNLYDDMSCYYWSAEPISTRLAGILLVEDSVPQYFSFSRSIGMPIRPVK